MLIYLFWFFVVPATLAALVSNRAGRNYVEYVEAELNEPVGEYEPPVTLIVPVKGLDHDLAGNLQSLAVQDYPDYELIVVTRGASDEGLRVARSVLHERVRVVVAGEPADGTGEKVHNLLEAVRQARSASEVFAFADSDGRVTRNWLRNLVAPLEDESLGATTGFRWYLPEDGGFWPLLRSAWDSTIAGNLRADDKNFAWGGGMALGRSTFEQASVAEFWRGAVSDDYRLTAAMNAAERGIRFVPGAMVATTGSCTAAEFLRWAARQLVITRVYRGKLWWAGFVAHIVYCGAMVMSLLVALTGNPLGLAGLVVTLVPGMAKGAVRGHAGRMMFPHHGGWFDQYGWAYFWMTPIATWIWLYTFLRSAMTRRIEWRGNVYELVSANETRCISSK